MSTQPIRAGMIGLDTSHVDAFTRIIHSPNSTCEFQGLRIVAAVPAGNPEFPLSRDRWEMFTELLRRQQVTIVQSIEELLPLVDVVMIESVDGRQHLRQVAEVFPTGKRTFIDKPLAASLADVLAIEILARQHGVVWFTGSAGRFTAGYAELKRSHRVGTITGCDVYCQSRTAPGHPDLYWYGVHGADLLFSFMGPGLRSVSAIQTEFTEFVRGEWDNGRIGTLRTIREQTGRAGLGLTVLGTDGIVQLNEFHDYRSFCREIVRFFQTGESPNSIDEMIEVFLFLEAAEQSKLQKGTPIQVDEIRKLAFESPTTIGLTPAQLIHNEKWHAQRRATS